MKQVKNFFKRGAYSTAQIAKLGWYTTQYVGARHITGPITKPGHVPKPFTAKRPSAATVRKSMSALFQAEAKDIMQGVYKFPREFRQAPSPVRLFKNSKTYFDEARAITRRSYAQGGATEVKDIAEGEYPNYYLQNFHFQTDGWLSDKSAEIYDTQVESLFTGTATAMRRRALPYIVEEIQRLADEGIPTPQIADIACGTGQLLGDIVDNYPDLTIQAVDLSSSYMNAAKRRLPKKAKVNFIEAPAEKLPFADQSVDTLLTVYLFHELPPKVRREVAAEFKRVLKPGGLYIHTDTIQYGDTEMDVLLESFPRVVHEPYYDSYCREELNALFGDVGLIHENETIGYLTKVSTFRCS